MTKHLPRQSLDKCMRHLNQFHVAGGAKAGLDVQGAKGSEKAPGGTPSGPPTGDLSSPTESLGAVDGNRNDANRPRVRFSKPAIIQVLNWKRENRAMNHAPRPLAPGAAELGVRHFGASGRWVAPHHSLRLLTSAYKPRGVPIGALTTVTRGSLENPCVDPRTSREDNPDQPSLSQGVGQGHKRHCDKNTCHIESTCSPEDWPGSTGKGAGAPLGP